MFLKVVVGFWSISWMGNGCGICVKMENCLLMECLMIMYLVLKYWWNCISWLEIRNGLMLFCFCLILYFWIFMIWFWVCFGLLMNMLGLLYVKWNCMIMWYCLLIWWWFIICLCWEFCLKMKVILNKLDSCFLICLMVWKCMVLGILIGCFCFSVFFVCVLWCIYWVGIVN